MLADKDASARSTSSWMLKWLGILWAAGTVISFAKRGFAIDLHGLPLVIYGQYAWLRDMLFEPLAWVFKEISPDVKDGVMLYGLIAATSSRMCRRYFVEFHGREPTTYERWFYTLLWPATLYSNVLVGLLFVEGIIVGCVVVGFFFWNYLGNAFGPN